MRMLRPRGGAPARPAHARARRVAAQAAVVAPARAARVLQVVPALAGFVSWQTPAAGEPGRTWFDYSFVTANVQQLQLASRTPPGDFDT